MAMNPWEHAEHMSDQFARQISERRASLREADAVVRYAHSRSGLLARFLQRVPGRTRGATQDSWTHSRASNLAEDVFRQQLLEIDRWLHFTNLSVRRNDL